MSDDIGFDHELSQDQLVAIGRRTMSRNFRQAPIVCVRGEGLYVWDRAGRRYLDFVGGIAVNGLGHSHPRFVEAVERQVRQLTHVSNLYFNEPQILLGQALSERFDDGLVFLCNSGAEANEAALKFARRYAHTVLEQPDRNEFVTFRNSFHGRTLGALAATGQPKYHAGFEPMIPGFHYGEFNDIESATALVGERTCAVMVEPLQAEGGLILAQPGFLAQLRQLCDDRGALLILDEVQVGCGRTGTFFAFEQEGARPDIVTLAKALGGGMPIGAMITREAIGAGFAPGAHGSTFAGNAVAARAALAFLEVMDEQGLLAHVRETGTWFGQELNKLADRFGCVAGARGRGFIWGLGLNEDWAPAALAGCVKRGLLVNRLNPRTLRFLPPLITQRSHIKAALDILAEVLTDLERTPPEVIV